MGFSQANAEGKGGYARIWKAQKGKGKFYSCQVSTSTKNKETDEYVTDFSGFATFIGHAYEKIKDMDIPESGLPIQILSCNVTTKYDADEEKKYTNFNVFDFAEQQDYDSDGKKSAKADKKADSKKQAKKKVAKKPVVDDDDDIPF